MGVVACTIVATLIILLMVDLAVVAVTKLRAKTEAAMPALIASVDADVAAALAPAAAVPAPVAAAPSSGVAAPMAPAV